jgi:hypothetical protein
VLPTRSDGLAQQRTAAPARMLHPVTVWCASCCASDQYMYLHAIAMP